MLKLLAILLMFVTPPASAEKLLFYFGDAPLSHAEGQEPKGLYFDIVTTIFDRMELDYKTEGLPFKRALHYAYNGSGIVVGIGATDERADKLDFSESIYDSTVVAFVKNEKQFVFSSIEDLRGKTIATKRGWSYGALFDQARKQKLFSAVDGKPLNNFQAMLLGRIDVFIDNRLSGVETMKALDAENRTTILPHPIKVFPHYLGFKKGAYTKLIERFNQELSTIKAEETFNQIISNYH